MTRYLSLIAIMLMLYISAAGAAALTITNFEDCRGKDVSCYENVSAIRSAQLASERERLFVAVERAQLDDYEQAREHRSYALWGQYLQGWVLLLIGIVIVAVGLVMSWKQMAKGVQDGVTLDNAFELGKDGLRFRSPVVGLFILGTSLWFFSTYIDKVYTLTLLPDESKVSANQAPDAAKLQEKTEGTPNEKRK